MRIVRRKVSKDRLAISIAMLFILSGVLSIVGRGMGLLNPTYLLLLPIIYIRDIVDKDGADMWCIERGPDTP